MKSDEREFFNYMQVYFDNGVLKKLYSNNNFCICNCCNSVYMIFAYKKFEDSYLGLNVNSEFVKYAITDKNAYAKMVAKLSPEALQKYFTKFNLGNVNRFLKVKQEMDIKGPTSEIDANMEQNLLRNESKIR